MEELYAGHALDHLNQAETKTLLAAIEQNPELAQELIAYEQALAAIAHTTPTPPPPHLKQQILAQATKSTKQISVLTIGGALSTLLLAIYSLTLRQQLQLQQAQITKQQQMISMLEQPKLSLTTLKGMDRAIQATGNLVSTPGTTKALLFLQNLPPLPPGQIYVVWAESQGKKIGCGSFRPNPQGKDALVIPVPASPTTTLIITQETSDLPIQPPIQPQGPMVMISQT